MRVVPLTAFKHAHHWLILQRRYVCQARKPLCAVCCLSTAVPNENTGHARAMKRLGEQPVGLALGWNVRHNPGLLH